MEVFNNRELAAGIWIAIFLCWMLYKSKFGLIKSFYPVVKASLAKPILISFVLLVIYSLCLVELLDSIELWKPHQAKNFVFWMLSVSGVYLSKLQDIESDPDYFTNAIISAFKISAAFQFVLNVYTFELWIEFILVPVVTFFVLLTEFSNKKEGHKKVAKISEGVLALFGVVVIGFTAYKLATNFNEFGKTKTFYDFVVPTALSILILPFYYLLAMYSAYERVFIRMGFFIKDTYLFRYAKWKAFFVFHFRFLKLDRWAHSLAVHNVKTKDEVDASISKIFSTLKLEKKRDKVPFSQGWSPYVAKDYLTDVDLNSGHYQEIEPGYWWSSTPYLDLDDEIMPNNIAFYVEGDENLAKKLILKLNVNVPCQSEAGISQFVEIADMLCRRALSNYLPEEILEAIQNKTDESIKLKGKLISVISSEFINEGYDIRVSIEVAD